MNGNKRLSELLGIPPKYKCSKDIYNNTWEFKELVDVIDRHNLNYPNDRWCLDDFEEVFPNFQEPENFVKLLNIMYSECQCMESVCDFFDTFGIEIVESTGSFQGDYLFLLYYSFTQFCPIFQDRFKTQAQQVNWKY